MMKVAKCELILLYLGHGRYIDYISVVTPEQDVLTLNDLSTNKPDSPKKTPCKKSPVVTPVETTTEPVLPKLYDLSTNTLVSPKRQPQKKKTSVTKPRKVETTTELVADKGITRTKWRINYVDLNLGIDSTDDKSVPRKHKQSKAIAFREPSQTVIAARNQRVAQKSIQNSKYEHTKLIGTVIITPPAKEIKGKDEDTKKIKTEQD